MGSGVRDGKPAPGSVAPLEYRPGRGYDQCKWCWLLCDRPLTEIRESNTLKPLLFTHVDAQRKRPTRT